MKSRNKAARPDEIVAEMLSAFDVFGVDKITEVIKKYMTVATYWRTLLNPPS